MSTLIKNVKRAKYPSDMSENGWRQLKKFLPLSRHRQSGIGRPPADLHQIINAIFYVVKTGGSWRSLPHDFPCWSTVYGYFSRWSSDGTWQWIHSKFVKKVRKKMKRTKRPSAASLDSQSSRTTACGGKHRG